MQFLTSRNVDSGSLEHVIRTFHHLDRLCEGDPATLPKQQVGDARYSVRAIVVTACRMVYTTFPAGPRRRSSIRISARKAESSGSRSDSERLDDRLGPPLIRDRAVDSRVACPIPSPRTIPQFRHLPGLPGDQPRASLEGQVRPRPPEQDPAAGPRRDLT